MFWALLRWSQASAGKPLSSGPAEASSPVQMKKNLNIELNLKPV